MEQLSGDMYKPIRSAFYNIGTDIPYVQEVSTVYTRNYSTVTRDFVLETCETLRYVVSRSDIRFMAGITGFPPSAIQYSSSIDVDTSMWSRYRTSLFYMLGKYKSSFLI